jgi:hypothetical protein
MSDLSDLQGVYGPSLRWNSEAGELVIMTTNEMFEREPRMLELGTQQARFVADMATRERGYGKVAVGLYEMVMTPVGSPPPPIPSDPEFKPALGLFLWSPVFGEVRLETCAAILRQTIDGFWTRYRSFAEASKGLQPIVDFLGRREILVKKRGTSYWTPDINIAGWIDRDKIAPFRLREPTVKPPTPIDSQIPFAPRPGLADLQKRTRQQLKSKPKSSAPQKPSTKDTLADLLDDEIPRFD